MASERAAMIVRVAANLSELRANLSEGKNLIETTTAAMGKLAASFDGSKITQQAMNVVAAVNQIGGASKLTAAEQERVNATLTKALEKYAALGREAPPGMRELEQATRKVAVETEQATQKTQTWGQTFTASLAGFLTAQAILGAVKGAFDLVVGAVVAVKDAFVGAVLGTAKLGDELLTLSNKSGIAVERLSAWRYVAGQTGTSVDAITSSVFKLQTELGQGGKDTTKALSAIGLSLSQLRASKPDEAFEQVLSKLREVPNVAERSAIGVALFGKGFKEMAGLTREDIGSMMARFEELGGKISTELAVSGDAFNDAKADWNLLVERINTSIGSAILPAATAFTNIMVNAVQKTLNESGVSAAQFDAQITRAFGNIVDIMGMMVRAIGFLVPALGEVFGGRMLREASGMVQMVSALGLQFVATAKAIDVISNQGRGGAFLSDLQDGLIATAKAAGDIGKVSTEASISFLRLGQDLDKIGAEMKGKGASALAEVRAQIAATAAEMRKGQEGVAAASRMLTGDADKAAAAMKKLNDQLSGAAAQADLKSLETAWKNLSTVQQASPAIIGRAVEAYEKLRKDGANSALLNQLVEIHRINELLNRDFISMAPNIGAVTLPMANFRIATAGAVVGGRDLNQTLGVEMDAAMRRATVASGEAGQKLVVLGIRAGTTKKETKELGSTLSEVGEVITGVFSNVNSTLGQSMQLIGGALTAIGEQGATMGKKLIAGFSAAAGVVGQYASASVIAAIATGALTGASAGLALQMAAQVAGGAAVGAAFAGIGAAVGALIGYFQYAAQKAAALRQANVEATESIEEMKKSILDMYGSVASLKTIGEIIGMDLVGGWGHQGVEGLRAFREQVEAFMDRMQDLTEGIEANAGLADAVMLRLIDHFATVKETAQVANDFILANVRNAAGGLNALTAALADAGGLISQIQATGLSEAVVGVFGELIARGASLREALEAVQPSIDAMREALDAAGMEGGAAFEFLAEMARMAADEFMGPLLDSLTGARDALTGLHNAGLLTQSSFAAIAMTATQAYDAIVAAGGDGTAALAGMAPVLQTIWKLQRDFGYEVDAATQKLLDQAEKAGLVGAQRLTDAERQTAAQEKLVEIMGQLLDAWQRLIPVTDQWGASAAAAAQVVTDATTRAATAARKAGTDLEGAGAAANRAAESFQEVKDKIVDLPVEIPILVKTNVPDVIEDFYKLGDVIGKVPKKIDIDAELKGSGFKSMAELEAIAGQAGRVYQEMVRAGGYSAAVMQQAFEAWQKALAAINPALEAAATGIDRAAAAGYQTKAALEAAAKASGDLYEEMRTSGLYTADVLKKAWEDWQADLEAAGARGAAGMTKALREELKGLTDMLEKEAPEEFMGSIERDARARVEAIQREAKEAAKATMMVAAEATARLTEGASASMLITEGITKNTLRAVMKVGENGKAAFELIRDAAGEAAIPITDIINMLDGADLGEPFRDLGSDVRDVTDDVADLLEALSRLPTSGVPRSGGASYSDFSAGSSFNQAVARSFAFTGGSSAPSGGAPYPAQSSASSSSAPIVIQVHTNLDGREVARTIVQHIPGAVQTYTR